jgi:hypothetical protein
MLFFHLIKDWPMLHAHDFLYIDVLQIKRQPTFVKKIYTIRRQKKLMLQASHLIRTDHTIIADISYHFITRDKD